MPMDIEGILTNQRSELLEVDLQSLEIELETGDYSKSYVAKCHEHIELIRKQRSLARQGDAKPQPKKRSDHPSAESPLTVPLSKLSPFNQAIEQLEPTEEEKLERELEIIRQADNPAAALKRYLKAEPAKDEAFIDAHFAAFNKRELSTMLGCIDFSEEFLEKYFSMLDHDAIAKKQRFNEEFFMKHFADLDSDLVIKHGVNEWRAKENRSNKLDVFLRLKGVRF